MSERLAAVLLAGVALYLGLGILFAIAFAARGAGRVDPAARGGTVGFRLLIVPGAAVFWPWLLRRWWRRQGPPEEDNPHRRRAREGAG